VKLRWGVSAVRHGEGLGAFYRASEGAEWSGCEEEWWPSVELQSFDFRRRRDGVALVARGEEEEAWWRLDSHASEVARGGADVAA
jgi:hypothetical protein